MHERSGDWVGPGSISEWVRQYVEGHYGPRPDSPRIGEVWALDGQPVEVTGGSYWGEPYWNGVPSISNAWQVRVIRPDGQLGPPTWVYDNDRTRFSPLGQARARAAE